MPPTPTFAKWKGETANAMLAEFWQVSGGNWDFIKTMAAENGSFDPYSKHDGLQKCRDKKGKTYYRHGNCDGTMDYSFGLNSAYHKDMIAKITARTATLHEIAVYHWDIYNDKEWTTSCGQKKFCGFNRRNSKGVKALFNK